MPGEEEAVGGVAVVRPKPHTRARNPQSQPRSPTPGLRKNPQPRRREGLRVMAKRPSDRRSPGRNPGPQGAFEVSMINVSCNSH